LTDLPTIPMNSDDIHGDALIRLLDDPDPQIAGPVMKRILDAGIPMIPYLEKACATTQESQTLKAIEEILRLLRLEELKEEITDWRNRDEATLLQGCWLVTRIQYPDLAYSDLKNLMQPIRNEIWLELGNHLTALEKIKVVNHLFFEKYSFELNIRQPDSPGNNLYNRILETRRGNPISLTLLYSVLCQELDLPVYAISIPGSIVLAYHDLPGYVAPAKIPTDNPVLFYINPSNKGAIIGHRDIMFYLLQNHLSTNPSYFSASPLPDLLFRQLLRLKADFESSGNSSRVEELDKILKLWD